MFTDWNKRIVLLAAIEKKYWYPRCAASCTLIPVLMPDCGRSEAVAGASECVVSRAISLTRLLNLLDCSRAIFFCFPLCSTCARCHSQAGYCVWVRDDQHEGQPSKQQRMHLYWWAAAPGAPQHQAAFPRDDHSKHHPSPICSCQRDFTKIGRAYPCLDLLHWPMPHHNLSIHRIFMLDCFIHTHPTCPRRFLHFISADAHLK